MKLIKLFGLCMILLLSIPIIIAEDAEDVVNGKFPPEKIQELIDRAKTVISYHESGLEKLANLYNKPTYWIIGLIIILLLISGFSKYKTNAWVPFTWWTRHWKLRRALKELERRFRTLGDTATEAQIDALLVEIRDILNRFTQEEIKKAMAVTHVMIHGKFLVNGMPAPRNRLRLIEYTAWGGQKSYLVNRITAEYYILIKRANLVELTKILSYKFSNENLPREHGNVTVENRRGFDAEVDIELADPGYYGYGY